MRIIKIEDNKRKKIIFNRYRSLKGKGIRIITVGIIEWLFYEGVKSTLDNKNVLKFVDGKQVKK